MEKIIFVLSILAVLQFLSNLKLLSIISSLKKKISKLEEEVEEFDEIIPGDKVTFNTGLTWKGRVSFDVTYEALVTDVTEKSVKVDAYDVTFISGIPSEVSSTPNYKNSILGFMTDKWVDRKEVSLILDKQIIRNKKLSKILN
jgi:hypothetical protein